MAAIQFGKLFFIAHTADIVSGFQVSRQRSVAAANTDNVTDSPVVCIGSMCGRHGPISLSEAKREASSTAEYELRGRHPYCAPGRSSPSRLLLLPLVAEHHGSSALASVLMSSSEVATLCTANTWKCDGYGLTAENGSWLETFSNHWDLSKHVLLAPHPDVKKEMTVFEEELQLGVPDAMKQAGIRRVFLLNLIMWRPVCLGVLSASTYNETAEFARTELQVLEDQVEMHKQLQLAKQPVLVMSLADLLWAPLWSQSRMEKMIPCIGKLDADAVPQLHHHHHPQNNFKFDTSVKEFGEANPSSQCDYSVEKRSCGRTHNAFRRLRNDEQKRARKAIKYLDDWSQ